jgi:galacturonokinase
VSGDFPGRVEFDLDDIPPCRTGDWANYPRGAAAALLQGHDLAAGVDAVVQGGLPVGGVSSSAALGVACLLALESANDIAVEPEENIGLDSFVENVYLGLDNGILDQSMILLGRPNHLTHMDCRSRRWRQIPLADGAPPHEILLVHSCLTTSLVETDYNRHVAECREAASMLMRRADAEPPVSPVLGDVPAAVLEAEVETLPERLRGRARHFVTEQQRVASGLHAWRRGDLAVFGRLVSQSGSSSIRNYGCGSPELISIFEELMACDGVYGARFSGAGFRGCCVALIDPASREQVAARVEERYLARFPECSGGFAVFSCRSGRGAGLL